MPRELETILGVRIIHINYFNNILSKLGTLLKGKNIIVEFPAEKRKNTKPSGGENENSHVNQDVEMKL